jgi:hypothetical protein
VAKRQVTGLAGDWFPYVDTIKQRLPYSCLSLQAVLMREADWHESLNRSFTVFPFFGVRVLAGRAGFLRTYSSATGAHATVDGFVSAS